MVARVRDAVRASIPEGATVLVVNKGDPELLALDGRPARPFPQDATGEHFGGHPADSRDAIAKLEAQRALGAAYLVIPGTCAWWLDYYDELARHLQTLAREVYRNAECGVIYEL